MDPRLEELHRAMKQAMKPPPAPLDMVAHLQRIAAQTAATKAFCEAVRSSAPPRELDLIEAGMETACCCSNGALAEEVWFEFNQEKKP